MKVLMIGGSGTISGAVADLLLRQGHEVTAITRGIRPISPGAEHLICDVREEAKAASLLVGRRFDSVIDFVGYTPEDVMRDLRLFRGKTEQYVYISSASAYQKPLQSLPITEDTPLCNPFWQYSRDKIACEELLMKEYRENGFPVTVVRPSHTYGDRSVPVGIHGKNGSWQTILRMKLGKPVIIHGDGTSLWTMTHQSDFAKGFVGLLGNIHAIGTAVQITSDESVTWNQIYSVLYRSLGVTPNVVHISSDFLAEASGAYRFGDALLGDKANSVMFDNTKLKRLVPDFCATVRVDTGLPRALSYMLEHEETQLSDPDFDAWCDRVIAAREKALRELV